eukprot:TRINITY_DN7539_c0_g1_i1.p1 TRINITY_DN7539_c0_g1~~TRINITY_DN7539_c0_g1_i1.p1  ORF type:complete len:455 (+),score=81.24 TRINITY_DN7539_c0_g1_i1:49-1365(+)
MYKTAIVIATSLAIAQGVSPRCQDILDKWCSNNVDCLNTMVPPVAQLYARNSTGYEDSSYSWRCYANSSLSPDKSHYTGGHDYCSRSEELASQLKACQATNTTFVEVFTPYEGGYPCIRIPAIVSIPTMNNRLLAFAECRNWTGDGCEPTTPNTHPPTVKNNNRDLCTKHSDDNGATWSNLVVIARGAMEPTPVWSEKRQVVVLQYNDLSSAVYQMKSTDGVEWTKNISINVPRAAVGPGPGLELNDGRLMFIGHVGNYAYDNVWYSTDAAGEVYNLTENCPVSLQGQNEASMTQLPSGVIVANMRNRHDTACDCRGVAYSYDNGVTFTKRTFDPVLVDPVNQGSIITLPDGTVVFANAASTSSRTNGVARVGTEEFGNGTISWNSGVLVWPGGYGYSCLTKTNPLSSAEVGLLWESDGPQCTGSGVSCRTVYSAISI